MLFMSSILWIFYSLVIGEQLADGLLLCCLEKDAQLCYGLERVKGCHCGCVFCLRSGFCCGIWMSMFGFPILT